MINMLIITSRPGICSNVESVREWVELTFYNSQLHHWILVVYNKILQGNRHQLVETKVKTRSKLKCKMKILYHVHTDHLMITQALSENTKWILNVFV